MKELVGSAYVVGFFCRVFREIEGVPYDYRPEWRRALDRPGDSCLAADSMAMLCDHLDSPTCIEKRRELRIREALTGPR